MNIASLLCSTAKVFAGRPAVAWGREIRYTYGQLADRSARFAASLELRLGLHPGDRVAFAMTNNPKFLEVLFGALHGGFPVVPMNAKLHQREFMYMLENSGARVCFATPDLASTIAPLAREIASLERVICTDDAEYEGLFASDPMPIRDVDPDGLAWLFYSSGTTGRPKGAMQTHRNLLFMCISHLSDVDSICEEDTIIHAAPMSHGSGMYIFPHLARGAVNVIPESGRFEQNEIFDLVSHYKGVSFYAAPTMVTRLINSPDIATSDTSNLKTLVYGGGPMYIEDLVRALELLGPKLVQIYGQAEAPMTISWLPKGMHTDTSHPHDRRRLGSTGIARTGVEVRVVDDGDRDLLFGEVGEVVVRGDIVVPGYWNNEAASAEALRNGWLHTGDLGMFDERGFLTLKDRSKDMIISGGMNIYPREIEEVLLLHEDLLEVSVVGQPEREWGEEVVAFIVQRAGSHITPEELDRLCLENVARFKRPRAYRMVGSLPKNNYGKVLKTDLREQLTSEKERRSA